MIKHVLAVLFGVLGAAAFVCGVVYVYTYLPAPHAEEADPTVTFYTIYHSGDPAMQYQTVGIKQCEHDALYKIEETRAVLLKSDDLAQVTPFLEGHFRGKVSAVLYVNTPRSETGAAGKPALVALQEDAAGHCILGIAENWSPQLFSKLETTYQPLLNQQQ